MPDRTPTGLPYPLPTDQVAGLPATFRELVELIATNIQPTGTVAAFGGTTAPAGWLLCNGYAYLQADHPALFAVIGRAFSITPTMGDPGPEYFRVPDLRGRVAVGEGDEVMNPANNVARTRGHFGGDTRMPAHNHGGNTGTDWPDHGHDISAMRDAGGQGNVGWTSGSNMAGGTMSSGGSHTRHQHGIPSDGAGTGGNMPPFLVLNYIIRT